VAELWARGPALGYPRLAIQATADKYVTPDGEARSFDRSNVSMLS
jgi:hypothetical protein